MKHERLARSMALKSTSRFRLGAVVVKKGKVIGAGFNKMGKTHPINKTLGDIYDRGIHAEIDACLGLSAVDLCGSTITICRVYKDGRRALAKPCWMCMRYLMQVGIKRIVYSTEEGYEEVV